MSQGKTTILIVDDTLVNLKLLSSVLTRQDYLVRAALNGKMALSLVETSPPDLILLDIAMPEMDGYTVCKQLKSDPKTRDIPIIFISALTDTDDIVRAFELGGVDYIIKPFRLKEVLARVESQLTLLKQRREIADIHERDRQQFARINTLRNQFIGTATHDLKNPLSVITGHAYLLQRHSALSKDETAQGYLEMINRAAFRMHRLIKNTFDLIQIESQTGVDMQAAGLKECLQFCVDDAMPKAAAKNVRLTLEDNPDIQVVMDSDRVGQAVEQLIANGIAYTPAEGSVTVRYYSNPGYVVIEVADTGTGIMAEDIPHLFEPFYRVHNSQQTADGGSGLGLAVVKAVVDKHQGQVQVESTPGEGSRFRFLLPLPEEPDDSPPDDEISDDDILK